MAQVQQGRLHPFLFQLFIRLFKLFPGIFIEHGDADVADFGIRQHPARHRLHLDIVPHDVRRKLLAVFVLQQQLDAGSLFPADGADHIFQGTAFGIHVVHLQDLVAGFDARLRPGGAFHGRYHYKFLVALAQYHADTPKGPVRHLVQVRKSFFIQVFGIGIVQAFHQAVHGALEQLFVRILSHIAGTDLPQRIQELQRAPRVMGQLMHAPEHADERQRHDTDDQYRDQPDIYAYFFLKQV